MSSFPTKNITFRYALALGLIALFSVSAYIILYRMAASQKNTAAVINVSGSQRLLSQRAAVYSLRLVTAHNKTERNKARQELLQISKRMESNHDGLIHGNASLRLPGNQSPQIHAMYFNPPLHLDKQLHDYIAEIQALSGLKPNSDKTVTNPSLKAGVKLSAPYTTYNPSLKAGVSGYTSYRGFSPDGTDDKLTRNNPHLRYILSASASKLIQSLDAVVKQYQTECEANNMKLQKMEKGTLGFTIFVLCMVALFIFRPMISRIENLKRSEEKFHLLAESSQDGILAYDKDIRYTFWNKAMERISGVTSEEVLGKTPFEMFPFLDKVGEGDAFRETITGKATKRLEMPYSVPQTGRRGYFESSH